MGVTQQRIQQARAVEIADICRANGVDIESTHIVKDGYTEYKVKGHQGLYIVGNHYYRHGGGGGLDGQEQKDKNNALTFYMEFFNVGFVKAVDYLCGGNFGVCEVNSAPTKPEYKEYAPPAPSEDYRRVLAYLIRTRGLSEHIVKNALNKGFLTQDSRGNCCFTVTDFETGKVVGAEIKGTYSDKPFQQCQFPANCGFNITIGAEVNEVIYLESAIDLLSFIELHEIQLKHSLLVSMGGLKPTVFDRLQRLYPRAIHWIAVDNDSAGNDFAQRIYNEYNNNIDLRRATPQEEKDWNDFLRKKKGVPH